MKKNFTLVYWEDDGWFVERLKEIPSVFSQGETLEELKENIEEVYKMMIENSEMEVPPTKKFNYMEIGLNV
jgi:predicted RNase H-like HicB family nuclease